MPGDKIEVYDGEYIHAYMKESGTTTVVFLPGMGTASPYYDYYKLADLVSKKYNVLVIEPLGYGFSSDTQKPRTLDNYENELSKVLEHFKIDNNIILLGHSYSGISNFNYANKHEEVKGLVCLDCTTAYQIETHVYNGYYTEQKPVMPEYYSYASPLGLVRLAYNTILEDMIYDELVKDIPDEYKDMYQYFLYNKTLNKTIIHEANDIYDNQLAILEQKYRNNLNVLTILSDETIKEMKEYKKEGDFYHDWEEMHNLLISNPEIQKIHVLEGNHYIHHGNEEKISSLIDEMISNMN